jgi:hypothetical protein
MKPEPSLLDPEAVFTKASSRMFVGVFLGAVCLLVVLIGWYALVALPEIAEYNDHLAGIRAAVERCECEAVCERTSFVKLPPSHLLDTEVVDSLTLKAVIN